MSDTPETDGFYDLIEGKCLSLDARYYHMRVHARKMELNLHEQCRLLGMSTERECDLRGKIWRLERELEQVREQYRLSSVCRQLKEENDKLKQQQP